ncbi:DUF3306 domain-containing protein [Acidovorax sp.]|uniref:DUF3306 domain-containing protein n=1 Tax=Acidovorax sp. TaxID=1872122 RepID=UPI000B137076|nr:DUF3306 domain-containing protein [Acidovorax sp.]
MADGFLGRWSRRKQDVREGKPLEEPPAPAPRTPVPAAAVASTAGQAPAAGLAAAGQPDGAVAPPPPPAPSLEDAQGLTPQSDFKPFVARDVAPEVRNLAMKKLFADPHFNVMDGLDIYIGDYSQPDPMPDGMLRKMVSAHTLGFFEHEKKQGDAAAPADTVQIATAAPRDDAGAQPIPDVAQLPIADAAPGVPISQPDLASASAADPLALSASHIQHDDQDAHLRLQPDNAPQRQGVGRGTA